MTASADKGNAFERSIAGYLRDQFGPHLTRPRPGAAHDLGDIAGIPDWTFELKCFNDVARGLREGMTHLAVEQANAGTTFGALILKRRGVTDPAMQLFIMRLGAAVPLIRETATWTGQP